MKLEQDRPQPEEKTGTDNYTLDIGGQPKKKTAPKSHMEEKYREGGKTIDWSQPGPDVLQKAFGFFKTNDFYSLHPHFPLYIPMH